MVFFSVTIITFTFIFVFLWMFRHLFFNWHLFFGDVIWFLAVLFMASHWMQLDSDQIDDGPGQTSYDPVEWAFKRKSSRRGAEGCSMSFGLAMRCREAWLILQVPPPAVGAFYAQKQRWVWKGKRRLATMEGNSLSSRPGSCWIWRNVDSFPTCMPTELTQWFIHYGRQPGLP